MYCLSYFKVTYINIYGTKPPRCETEVGRNLHHPFIPATRVFTARTISIYIDNLPFCICVPESDHETDPSHQKIIGFEDWLGWLTLTVLGFFYILTVTAWKWLSTRCSCHEAISTRLSCWWKFLSRQLRHLCLTLRLQIFLVWDTHLVFSSCNVIEGRLNNLVDFVSLKLKKLYIYWTVFDWFILSFGETNFLSQQSAKPKTWACDCNTFILPELPYMRNT